ncbi:MAG: glycosyltransferase family 39 protein [Pseudomonadota bacterium]
MSRAGAWIFVLLITLAVRVASLSAYPLHDTTEARYSEIARIMVVTNEWLIPQVAPGMPFWAKPPLSIWATAASLKLFGATEFAVRLPALLFSLAAMVIVYGFCARRYSATTAWAAAAVFLSSGVGFVGAGAVMTDAALTLAVTVSVIAFASRLGNSGGASAIAFFLGLALGLLAKGPVAIVLVAMPVALWSLRYRSLSWLWSFLPWFRGLGLVCLLALPWYFAAESRSPGFLNYFLIGEHFLRFVDSGWTGDLYGNAHDRPLGTIWLYGLMGLLPWSVIAGYATLRNWPRRLAGPEQGTEHEFFVLAALAPLLFFTLAGNVLPAYVMPTLPALSVLLGRWLAHRSRSWASVAATVPALVLMLMYTGVLDLSNQKSQKSTLEALSAAGPEGPVFYFERMPYSASFYSNGATTVIRDSAELDGMLSSLESGRLIVQSKHEGRLGPDALACMALEGFSGDFSIFSFEPCVQR